MSLKSVLISFEAAFAWFMATDSRIFALTLLHHGCHRPIVDSGIFTPGPCSVSPAARPGVCVVAVLAVVVVVGNLISNF